MPRPYVPYWVEPELFDPDRCNVWIPHIYEFKNADEPGLVCLWDRWLVHSANWWDPNAKWSWLNTEVATHQRCDARYPEILSFEAASGGLTAIKEPLPSMRVIHCPKIDPGF